MYFKCIGKNMEEGLGQQRHISCWQGPKSLTVSSLRCSNTNPQVSACRRNSIQWGKGRKAVFAFRKIILIIFTLDKKKDSPNQASPVGKQEKAEVLNSSPIAAGRRAAFIPPPHVLVTRPLPPGTWAPYLQPRQPWPGGRPMGPFPGRGRGQPRYIHPV